MCASRDENGGQGPARHKETALIGESPEDIVKRRYAVGEIDRETFE